jgi:1-acyl-sn-glycerol-3-phosphate acyltransferase
VVPPRPIRRLVVAPAFVVVALLVLTTLPLWLIGAALISPRLPGRWRALRILSFFLVAFVLESLALLALLVLWIASGFGLALRHPRSERAHWVVVRAYLTVLFWSGRRVFNLGFDVEADDAKASALDVEDALHEGPHDLVEQVRRRWWHRRRASIRQVGRGVRWEEAPQRRPLLVFSRHAGPGDSVLLVHALVQQGLRPHIVLRDTLQWAPALDTVLNRLPSLFTGPRRRVTRDDVAALARDLRPGDALVLFPEGRNFTPHRRLSSITRLEELGDHEGAERARELRHVLVPRAGGASAALAAAPGADVVFVAHTGLEDLSSLVDLWRGTPMDANIRVTAWRVAAEDVPRNPHDAAAWLHDWWRRIDRWILEHHGRAAVPDAVVDELDGSGTDGGC